MNIKDKLTGMKIQRADGVQCEITPVMAEKIIKEFHDNGWEDLKIIEDLRDWRREGSLESEEVSHSLKVKLLCPNAKLPTRAHEGDAGLDLYTPDSIYIKGETTKIPMGIAVEIPRGYYGRIVPRSSTDNLIIQEGIIDSGYRGEIFIKARTIRGNDCHFLNNCCVAQLIITPYYFMQPVQAFELPESERGERGDGSSGK